MGLIAYVRCLQGALEDFGGVVLCGDIVQGRWSAGAGQYCLDQAAQIALTYYFSTHGCSRFVSCLLSPALGLELLDAAAAAARALLLKKLEAMDIEDSVESVREIWILGHDCWRN